MCRGFLELLPASEYWDIIVKSREAPLLALIYRVPPRLWRKLSQAQEELKALDSRQLFAKPSTFHVTVKVLNVLEEGKITAGKLESLISRTQKVVSEFSPFEISLKGLGVFPTAVYAKVEDPLDQFRMINKRIIEELGTLVEKGQFDGDAYIPHVTLATFNTKEADELLAKVKSPDLQELHFGAANVLELEAVRASMYLLLGPEDLQDGGFQYLRSMQLQGKTQ